MRLPAQYDLIIYSGNDFKETFEFQDDGGAAIDFSGWTVKSQIRAARRMNADLIEEFTINTPDATGIIFLQLTDIQTKALAVGTYYYDILFTNTSDFDEIYVEGKVIVKPTVTEKAE